MSVQSGQVQPFGQTDHQINDEPDFEADGVEGVTTWMNMVK